MLHQNKNQKHIPVLLSEVLTYLRPKSGDSYLDLTAGYGGHAGAILEQTKAPEKVVLIDRDPGAIKYLAEKPDIQKAEIRQSDFLSASRQLRQEHKAFDMILADLGVSSQHLDIASRGFSIKHDGPLDMRMDQTQTLSAETIVNTYSETALTDILRKYGEEPKAHKIARSIKAKRPVTSTHQLAQIVASVYPGYSKIHPASRSFQALRIAVNGELDQLEQALPIWLDLLKDGGRLVVISFHSLEDRIVKEFFAEHSRNKYDATLELLTRQPVTGSPTELVHNPRARSAKLRAVVKIKIK